MIGKRIKHLRNSWGLTQTELGNKLGVVKQTVSSWENDVSSPNSDTLLYMAHIFNVTVDYLLGTDKADINYQDYQMNTSAPEIDAKAPVADMNFLKTLTNKERYIVDVYRQLDADDQDIILGEMKKCLKEQRLKSVATDKAKQK